ncbi:fluoride efflux transporter CrcB [Caedibacter taeniospiralis]|uniref:fluoride efflux transporter CrcB n=1 Tax=Caedibacter taeniospiralis TaxID=28907 RepID=UPI000C27D46C|nr:fluoride efflux transporter CrcB [Caedibacter taeniospiralis]
MLAVLLVGLGGSLGSISRFWVAELAAKYLGRSFPFGILFINVVGCLLIGVMAALLLQERFFLNMATHHLRALVVTGFLGGFTTFSSFSLDTLMLLQKGEWLKALSYIVLSVVISLIAVAIGFYLTQRCFSPSL